MRRWAHHSVVTLRDIPAGSVITPEMIGVKRPGWGVPAKHLEAFYGYMTKTPIRQHSLLRWEDVEVPASAHPQTQR